MVILIIIWPSLALIFWMIGIGFLHHLKSELLWQKGDLTIISIWLGLSLFAISLLFACLFVPLSPSIGLVTAIVLLILTRSHFTIYREIREIIECLSWQWLIGTSLLTLIVAALASQQVTTYDTGFYHFPAIKWLSEYGLVPGLSLLHYPLGYPSSWLALSASLNAGFLTDRAATVMGGFALLLGLLQTNICAARIIKRNHQVTDWFFVISIFLCLSVLTWFRLPISPSPDVAVIILSIFVVWIILILSQKETSSKQYLFNTYLIPVILAAAAVTSKLSALPLFLTSALFFAFSHAWQWKRVLGGAIIGIILLLPMFAFATIATGCPLFPSALLCFDNLPWSLKTETVKEITRILQNCARWTCPPDAPLDAQTWDWIGHWLQEEKRAIFLIIFSIFSLFALLNKPKISGQNYLIGLGIVGTIFVMYGSPYLRIGISYFFIIPALLLAIYCHKGERQQVLAIWAIGGTANLWLDFSPTLILLISLTLIFSVIIWQYYRIIKAQFLLAIFCLLIGLVPMKMYLNSSEYKIYWLFPAKIQLLHSYPFVKRQVNDIIYWTPDPNYRWERSPGFFSSEDRCWNIDLPCTPQLTYTNIRLRNPDIGLAGGFVRTREP
jgi:hypothetical protein